MTQQSFGGRQTLAMAREMVRRRGLDAQRIHGLQIIGVLPSRAAASSSELDGSAGSDPVFGFQEPLANGLDLCLRGADWWGRSFEQVEVRTGAAKL